MADPRKYGRNAGPGGFYGFASRHRPASVSELSLPSARRSLAREGGMARGIDLQATILYMERGIESHWQIVGEMSTTLTSWSSRVGGLYAFHPVVPMVPLEWRNQNVTSELDVSSAVSLLGNSR